MKQGLSLRVSQHLALTPQLQQSIRLLQLSTMELSQEIEQMLDDNPFLEKDTDVADREAFGLDQADARTQEAQESGDAAEMSLSSDDAADAGALDLPGSAPGDGLSEITVSTSSDVEPGLEGVAEGWEGDGSVEFSIEDSEWGGDAPPRNGALDDDTADATELARSVGSLTDFLHQQALSLRLSETDRAALRFMIESLNDDGYLEDSLRSLAEGLAGGDEEQLEELEQIGRAHV